MFLGGMAVPQPAGAMLEDFIKQVGSFKVGAGAGPTGLRPQFVKELSGECGDIPCVTAMHQFAMLFVAGRAPNYLRRWYGGGTLMGINITKPSRVHVPMPYKITRTSRDPWLNQG